MPCRPKHFPCKQAVYPNARKTADQHSGKSLNLSFLEKMLDKERVGQNAQSSRLKDGNVQILIKSYTQAEMPIFGEIHFIHEVMHIFHVPKKFYFTKKNRKIKTFVLSPFPKVLLRQETSRYSDKEFLGE